MATKAITSSFIVGAGDFEKQEGQLGGPGLKQRLDFCFSENGVHAFRGEQLLHCKSIVEQLGESDPDVERAVIYRASGNHSITDPALVQILKTNAPDVFADMLDDFEFLLPALGEGNACLVPKPDVIIESP